MEQDGEAEGAPEGANGLCRCFRARERWRTWGAEGGLETPAHFLTVTMGLEQQAREGHGELSAPYAAVSKSFATLRAAGRTLDTTPDSVSPGEEGLVTGV